MKLLDYIVLLSTICASITTIAIFIHKQFNIIGIIKNKLKENKMKQLKEVLDILIPNYLNEHDHQTRQKYLSDRQQYLKDISNEVQNNIQSDLNEIKNINQNQNKIIDILLRSSIDVMRIKIERIYYQYEQDRKMPLYQWEYVQELYADYTRAGGNHHIHKLYNRMNLWDKTDELPQYEKYKD